MVEHNGKVTHHNVLLKSGPQINSETVLLYPQLTKDDAVKVLKRIVDSYDESWYYVRTQSNICGYLPTYAVVVE